MMKKYNSIVVGSGVSGLTASLILAMNGHKVLLLEKAPRIGGSLARFYRNGVPFDTGFHFTGGLHKGGVLYEMLSVLGIRELVQPVFLAEDRANLLCFESENRRYEIPYGVEKIRRRLKDYFPDEAAAIDIYFDKVRYVCDQTPTMDLLKLTANHNYIDEDFITLEEVLNGITQNHILKDLLSCFAMCYGVQPKEVSFANHSRMCLGLYQSIARVRDGGAAFINAFRTKFKDYDVEVCSGKYITGFADIHDDKAGSFILNTGEDISAEHCMFTIHPKEILKILPKEYLSRAFINRVSSFEPSTGFFSVFTILEGDYEEPDFGDTITTLLPGPDVNALLTPAADGDSALVLIKSIERVGDKTYKVLNTFEPSCPMDIETWKDSGTGIRPGAYYDYKKKKVEKTVERILKVFPQYKGRLKVIDSASMLTFRDYLNSPDGSAYGIKQKAGQYNLVGKLPLRNLYAAGQSSLLPGIVGAMMSSFIVARSIIKEDQYNRFLSQNLCN
jgi:all-trans-retinol 13,14-reductase